MNVTGCAPQLLVDLGRVAVALDRVGAHVLVDRHEVGASSVASRPAPETPLLASTTASAISSRSGQRRERRIAAVE